MQGWVYRPPKVAQTNGYVEALIRGYNDGSIGTSTVAIIMSQQGTPYKAIMMG
jgi:hypothetical protein